jgi:hypothetical protein
MMYLGIILTAVLVLALLFLYFIYITTPKSGKPNKSGLYATNQSIQTKWSEVQQMMQAGGPANFKQSIMEADKLVDTALKSRVKGETMGERLKNARDLFTPNTYNDLWTAHKIRNRLAHEAEFEGLSSEASLAVRNFEKALRELRVL